MSICATPCPSVRSCDLLSSLLSIVERKVEVFFLFGVGRFKDVERGETFIMTDGLRTGSAVAVRIVDFVLDFVLYFVLDLLDLLFALWLLLSAPTSVVNPDEPNLFDPGRLIETPSIILVRPASFVIF